MNNVKQYYSRRDFIGSASLLSAGLFMPRTSFFLPESPVDIIINEAKKSPIIVENLRNNVSLLQGSGGNIGVFSGPDGKLMIDAGIDVSESKIKISLGKISPTPLKYLVNTHWHFDHTSGNEWLNKEGAVLVSHINTKKNLSKEIRVKEWNHTFSPAPKRARPAQTFESIHTIEFNNVPVRLEYFGNAHTDGDISVHFGNADILFLGDLWWNGYYPFIDADTGGNIKGLIAAIDGNLKLASSSTIIIPGHGPRGNKSQLEAYRDMLEAVSEKVENIKKQGKTLAETIASTPTKEYNSEYGNFLITGDWFTKLVYQSL